MEIRLEVRTEERKWVQSPMGFRSTDEESYIHTLVDFCRQHNIPYRTDFVSVWVMPAGSSQVKQLSSGRTAWIRRNADAYGTEIIILGEHAVDNLALVSCGDFQNTILEADKVEKAGGDVERYLRDMLFIFPQQMAHAERAAMLEQASQKARRKIKLGDAEARLLRRLINSDKA